uniref:Uncharacterized protein n=1 Tax=viral metagenome TaxID=1070528 RepID=A0A6C0JY31_9ZZZZ
MINPNYISLRPIGKFASGYDAKSSRVWYSNLSRVDKLREDEYQRSILRKKYPKYSLTEIETIRLRTSA